MRPNTRKAVALIIEQGTTQREAAARAGMDESALGRALRRPPIAAYIEQAKAQQALDAFKLKEQARAIAIRTGMDLMTSAQSEAVRARMVEFFAGEDKQPLVNVQINPQAASAYTFAPPPRDVTPKDTPADSLSGALDGQAIEIAAQSDSRVSTGQSTGQDEPQDP